MPLLRKLLFFTLLMPFLSIGQDIELYQQFNGRYDYLSFGNTLLTEENGGTSPCAILQQSSADFTLTPDQTLIAALLYWAGPGTGDLEVDINGIAINSDLDFNYSFLNVNMTEFNYFSGFADITNLLASEGNGTYTFSNLDLEPFVSDYCQGNGGNATNFGGWAVTVIYEDAALPLNQVSVFHGLQGVLQAGQDLDITLDNLNVLDNQGAKIGFLAWEGDVNIANNETLSINGNLISNPPLNPIDNAFNGTNSFTGSDQLYNMDIDFYDIQNNIQPGDLNATIKITSSQDLVMVNNVVTVLNTELPDGTVTMDTVNAPTDCGDRDIDVDYTVSNTNSTKILPAGTSLGFYANNTLIVQTQTQADIPIDGSESGSISLTIPDQIPADFLLRAFIDDIDDVPETNETNNEDNIEIHLLVFPEIDNLINLELCQVVGVELFDLTLATAQIDPINTISYHLDETDAQSDQNAITEINSFENTSNPQEIWVRVSNPDCFVVGSFLVEVIDCPLPDASISIDNEIYACRERDLVIEYTISNTNATAPLPAGTGIFFFADTTPIGQTQTLTSIPIGGSESSSLTVTLSEDIPNMFVLFAYVDNENGLNGDVQELNEFNNEIDIIAEFGTIPAISGLPNLIECDLGFNTALFDLTQQNEQISTAANSVITYFTTEENAILNENPISDPEQYENGTDPQTIFVRHENEICFTTASFLLTTENCTPVVPEGMSPNNDSLNDNLNIVGLVNVFEEFRLQIFSRNGNLIYEGGNDDGLWDGIPNTGILNSGNVVPTGTYYYVLELNDPNFNDSVIGWFYVNY